jgi:hypothetical protein
MNFVRVGLSALAALPVYFGVGFLVHVAMQADLAEELQRAGITRSPATMMALLPIGITGAIVGAFAFAYSYAKGYEGGPGLQEGLRFGVLVGLMFVAFGATRTYMTFPVPLQYLASAAVATVIQFAAIGMVVGLIYRK